MSVKIRELRPGKYFIVVHYMGKRWVQLVGQDKAEAERYANELRREIEFQGVGALDKLKLAEPEGITVAKYGAAWLDEIDRGNLKLATKNSYHSNFDHHIKSELGHLRLEEVTYRRVKHWILDKKDAGFTRTKPKEGAENQAPMRKYSKDTIRLMVATLRLMLDEAVKEELIAANPVQRMGKLYGSAAKLREDPDPFGLDELHTVEEVCRNRFPLYYEFILSQSRCGIRIGEAIALQLGDIDLSKRTLMVRRTMPIHRQIGSPKTASSKRTVDMSPQLAEALHLMIRKRRAEYLAAGKNEIPDWLFCNTAGKPLDYSRFAKRWNQIQMVAQVRRRRPHDLRHTYASLNLMAGKALAYVSAQLGHKNPRITLEIYTRFVKGADPGPTDTLDVRPEATGKGDLKIKEEKEKYQNEINKTATGDNRISRGL
jgi:integrase